MQVMNKYQETVNEAGRKYFTAINLPTRDDIKSLGERLGVMEERLGRIEAMLAGRVATDGPGPSGPSAAPAPRPRPKRTKKPPKTASGASGASGAAGDKK
jgi:hypothetical protein